MNPETRQAIDAHALRDFPREACGLVVDTAAGEIYLPCRNIARTVNEHFAIHPMDYADAEERGEITCVVHSHPNIPARPSQGDKVACEKSNKPWFIVAVWKQPEDAVPRIVGDFMWAPSGYEAPLVGREFFFGVLDCYTLLRDWYKRERNIELLDFERHDNFWNDKFGPAMDLYAQYELAGFKEVRDDIIRVGDVALMQIRAPFANHAGVFVGEDQMLHHMYGHLSMISPYRNSMYQEKTRRIIRYLP
jgi:proteasome lid subunit RPN8/RPN11